MPERPSFVGCWISHITPSAPTFVIRGRVLRDSDGIAPRVSDVVNKKTAKFTIDTLVEMLSRIGKPVKLTIS